MGTGARVLGGAAVLAVGVWATELLGAPTHSGLGVMRALGASRWLVRRTMLDESLLITISGALAGIGVGTLIAWLWLRSIEDVLPLEFTFPWAATLWVAAAAVVLGVLASVLPARRAARLKVIEALSYE